MDNKTPPNPIDLLDQVKRVDAPPFLYTRIEARINAAREGKLGTRWVWAGSVSLLLLLFLNLYVVKQAKEEPRKLSEFSYLAPKNSIYE